MTLQLKTNKKRQVLDITKLVEAELAGSGLASVFIRHTTAALTTADLDPGTDQDILDALEAMTPQLPWHHPHDPKHFPDHLWSSLLGPNLLIPYQSGHLQLGTWQRLVLIELDGPMDRQIELTLIKI